jgi:ribonuclease HI
LYRKIWYLHDAALAPANCHVSLYPTPVGHKNEIAPDLCKSKFREILQAFDVYEHIYTDASKDGSAVAAAALSRLGTRVKRFPDDASIFSGEAQAILLALDMAEQAGCEQVLIMVDSLSCLQSIENRHLSNALVLEIIMWVHEFLSGGHKITFMWLPSHVGLSGNVAVDATSKAALNLPIAVSYIPYSEFKPVINSYVATKWQQSWDAEVCSKLHGVQPRTVSARAYRLPRRGEVIIHRLHVGHTRETHSHLLKEESPPMCIGCRAPLAVQRMLIDCVNFALCPSKYFNAATLHEIFENVNSHDLIDFIKEIGLCCKL